MVFWDTQLYTLEINNNVMQFPSAQGLVFLLIINAKHSNYYNTLYSYFEFERDKSFLIYRVSQKALMPFIFKLTANLLLEFVCFHLHSQHEVVNDCKKYSSIQISTINKMHFNFHMGLDSCFKLINGSLI